MIQPALLAEYVSKRLKLFPALFLPGLLHIINWMHVGKDTQAAVSYTSVAQHMKLQRDSSEHLFNCLQRSKEHISSTVTSLLRGFGQGSVGTGQGEWL